MHKKGKKRIARAVASSLIIIGIIFLFFALMVYSKYGDNFWYYSNMKTACYIFVFFGIITTIIGILFLISSNSGNSNDEEQSTFLKSENYPYDGQIGAEITAKKLMAEKGGTRTVAVFHISDNTNAVSRAVDEFLIQQGFNPAVLAENDAVWLKAQKSIINYEALVKYEVVGSYMILSGSTKIGDREARVDLNTSNVPNYKHLQLLDNVKRVAQSVWVNSDL